jgi:hypothetical protein
VQRKMTKLIDAARELGFEFEEAVSGRDRPAPFRP